tara:strand:- start:415 stop:699 length:285 start_codon:yes stop_codon:yes gene_type:complete
MSKTVTLTEEEAAATEELLWRRSYGQELSQIITLTEEEAALIEGLIFDAKRAASKLHTMYLRSEIEPRLELDRLVEQRDLYLKAQKILRERKTL